VVILCTPTGSEEKPTQLLQGNSKGKKKKNAYRSYTSLASTTDKPENKGHFYIKWNTPI
jgi:hypothetical protein